MGAPVDEVRRVCEYILTKKLLNASLTQSRTIHIPELGYLRPMIHQYLLLRKEFASNEYNTKRKEVKDARRRLKPDVPQEDKTEPYYFDPDYLP